MIEKKDLLRPEWSEVKTQISINNYDTISISLDNTQASPHFNGQPIGGVVDEFINGFMHDKMKDEKSK